MVKPARIRASLAAFDVQLHKLIPMSQIFGLPNVLLLALADARRHGPPPPLLPNRQRSTPPHDRVKQRAIEHDEKVQPENEPHVEHDGQSGFEAEGVDEREQRAEVERGRERSARWSLAETDRGAYCRGSSGKDKRK